MAPEWGTVQRLLVVFADQDPQAASALLPALGVLKGAMPQTDMTLLAVPSCATRLGEMPEAVDLFRQILPREADAEDIRSLIDEIKNGAYGAAVIFTRPNRSPYFWGYVCYLAGIPLRLGQSSAFGGAILSPWVKPTSQSLGLSDHYLAMLASAGLRAPDADAWHEAFTR